MIKDGKGQIIDSYDVVVRQKRCSETLNFPEDWGSKTDVVCGSFTIATELPKDMPGCEYWVFMDSRHTHVPPEQVEAVAKYVPCTIHRELCDEWNEKYRNMRTSFFMYPGQEIKATSDDLGHTHMSAGLHTLIYACHILKPEQITLFGFDNVKDGYFTWSVTRGPEWKKYPDHNWATEHKMVPVIAEHFDVQVEFM